MVAKYHKATLAKHWDAQLEDLHTMVRKCEGIQRIWDAMAPPAIKPATGNLKSAALTRLAESLELGDGKWLRQFAYGFPLVGDLSQCGVYPRDDSLSPAPSTSGIWENASKRFQERAAHSGHANATTLWGEAFEQVLKGWPGAPPADRYPR